jgi:transcriptional regulator with XRE-family HTH domain
MNSTFGTRLREQRERQQISLATISERTKIKLSLLEALERDDVSHWPHGIFGRSYLRSYAQAIGLDPDTTVREFAEIHAVEPPDPSLSELRDKTAERSDRWPPTRLQFLIDSAIDAFHARRAEGNSRSAPVVETGRPARPAIESPGPSVVDGLPLREATPIAPPVPPTIDFGGLAHLCTRLACAQEAHELAVALEEAAALFDAVGVILWIPDRLGVALTTALAHGYPEELIAQLPSVSADGHNAIAVAFRTRDTCVVNGSGSDNGAIVTPLLTPSGCSGVLSFELRHGAEQRDDLRAAATILAAQVSTLMGFSVLAQTRSA